MDDDELEELWNQYPGVMEELEEYVDPETVGIEFETIPKEDKENIKFWLQSKIDLEGPPDPDKVAKFANEGRIKKPIIIDARNDYTVEGRHRLAAALRYNFDVPALIIFDNNLFEASLGQFYGSNFQHTLKQYTKEEGGLATHGVHYSDYKKWGIAPGGSYFPRGVYFYYLSNDCNAAIGNGFATNRKWANVAKIDNNKMVILKQGHPRNFSRDDLKTSLTKLESKLGNVSIEEVEESKFDRVANSNPSFQTLGNILSGLEKQGHGSFNKLLKIAGYSGIVDYDQELLPVESCQGVVTWPDGASLVESAPTPEKSPSNEERLVTMLKRLKHEKDGSLQLSADEIRQVIKMLPKFHHVWDISDSKADLYSLLLRKLDFDYSDATNWLEEKDYFGDRFYMALERNPTTPKRYWEQLRYSPDHGAKETAKNMLGESFSKARWQKLAGLLKEEEAEPRKPKTTTWYHGTREEIKGDLRPIYLTPNEGLAELHGHVYKFKLEPDARWLDLSKVEYFVPSMDSIGYIDGMAEKFRDKGYDVLWDSEDYYRGHHQIYVVNPGIVSMMKIV